MDTKSIPSVEASRQHNGAPAFSLRPDKRPHVPTAAARQPGQGREQARKIPPSEQKPPPKVTPVPIPVPFGYQLPPKPPARPVPKPSPLGSEQPTRINQSLTSSKPTVRETGNAKIKRTGSGQNPFVSRLAPPVTQVQRPRQPSPEPPEEKGPPSAARDIVSSPVPIPRPAGSTPVQTGVRPLPQNKISTPVSSAKAKASDEDRRKAITAALKARRAPGSTDHVHTKRRETLQRLKEEEISVVNLLPEEDTEKGGMRSAPTSSRGASKQSSMRPDFATLFSNTDPAASSRHAAPDLFAADSSGSETTDSDVEMVDDDTDSRSVEDADHAAEIYSSDSKAAVSTGDWRSLWNYLQPLLTKHKGPTPPDKDHVQELIVLPQVRDLEWRDEWILEHPFLDSQPRDVLALVLQTTGELAPELCSCCADGEGPFDVCVIISRKAHEHALDTIFSCGNCLYRGRQADCSHETWGMLRAEVISDARAGRGSPRRLADVLSGKETGAASDSGSALDSTEDGSPPPVAIPAPSITMAEPMRPYATWPDESGHLASTFGALLPKGYQLDHSIPGRQWICPVRACRRVFQARKDLGFHFNRAHFGCLLNDNGDGTLSATGSYQSRATGTGRGGKMWTHAPPLITSKDAIPPKDALPSPDLPRYLAGSDLSGSRASVDSGRESEGLRYPRRQATGHANVAPGSSLSATTTPSKTTGRVDKEAADPDAFWEYIRPFLHSTTLPPDTGFVKELLQLPRLRDLVINPKLPQNYFRERTARDVAAMLIQLSGETMQTCTRCATGKGPFSGCYVIARKADGHARGRYIGCGNCVYQGNQSLCTLKNLVVGRSQSPIPKFSNKVAPQKDLNLSDSRAQLRAGENDEDCDVEDTFTGEQEEPPSKRQRTRHSTASLPTARDFNSTPLTGPSSGLVTAGHLLPPHVFEMEDWEIAPGRVREAVGEDPDNIAFSKAYLTTNRAVPVCDDVAFRVDTITSGTTLFIEADSSKTRICSLAAGKLQVRIKGEQAQEFTIGPHGMFRVKAGVSCSVTNRLYIDSILHTTLLSGYI